MTLEELRDLIRGGENSRVEFKRDDIKPEELAREIVGFLNVEGGQILIGVEDDGTISGVKRPDLELWVLNSCRESIEPPTIPSFELVAVAESSKVGVITLQNSAPDKPYKVRKGGHTDAIVRIGASCRKASREEEGRLYRGEPLVFSQEKEKTLGPAGFENPYDFNKPATKFFRGREVEFQRLTSLIREEKSAVVWGLQRIGKTSLVEKVLDEVAQPSRGQGRIMPLRINMFETQEFFRTDQDFLFTLSDLLATQLRGNPEKAKQASREMLQTGVTYDLYKNFRIILERGKRRTRSSLLLFIDEFQDISKAFERAQVRKTPNPINAGLIRFLGSLVKEGTLQLIICCRYKGLPLDRRLDFQLFKLLTEINLGVLDEPSARSLIRDPVAGRIKYDEQQIKRILELTGNNPFLIQYFCSELVTKSRVKKAQMVKKKDVDECADEIVSDPTREPKFNVLYEDFLEIDGGHPWKVLLALAHNAESSTQFVNRGDVFETCRHDLGIRCDERVLMQAMDRLVQGQVVAEERRGPVPSYIIRSDLLRLWVRNQRYFEKAI